MKTRGGMVYNHDQGVGDKVISYVDSKVGLDSPLYITLFQ
jgi:hypothetical protein